MSKANFTGRVLVVGCGAVSRCTIPLLLDVIKIDPANVTVIDFLDNRKSISAALERGVTFVQERINSDNYAAVLSKYLTRGDIMIDLAWNIKTLEILQWCRDNTVRYLNTSVEEWDPYTDLTRTDPKKYTLYTRQMELKNLIGKWSDNNGATAIVDHGANPGLVSHFTKHALIQIAKQVIEQKRKDIRVPNLQTALDNKDFKKLAQLTNVQVIHISERDSQITSVPKQVNEFVNTWSIEGLYEEGIAPAELGWGTHEKTLPAHAFQHATGPKNQICLSSLGMNTWARSWVPSGEILGMVIRHGEAFGISDRLTVWDGDHAVYRPTVHYVYCPSDSTIASLHELKMRQYDLQQNQRILSHEIIDGKDELGVLLMGHDFKAWWTGSMLDIHEASKLAPRQNATTLQVAISVIAGVAWMIDNPNKGLCLPDDIDHEFILKIALPYLGPFYSQAVDWSPLDNMDQMFNYYGEDKPKLEDQWQFSTFLRS